MTSTPTPMSRSTVCFGVEPRHPGLPNSPCGRKASTRASSAKVKTIEYCVQHSFPVVGRYDGRER